jgi:hypothetical protein
MSLVQTRGGFPHVFRASIDTIGRKHDFPFVSLWLCIRTKTAPVRVYFTEADFTANANYILVPVPAADTPHGEWKGPLEVDQVWLRGDGGTAAVELVAAQRRG